MHLWQNLERLVEKVQHIVADDVHEAQVEAPAAAFTGQRPP